MELGLKKAVDRFYDEMDKEESWDIGEMACSLVPRLVSKIYELEKQIEDLTSDSSENCDNESNFIKDLKETLKERRLTGHF